MKVTKQDIVDVASQAELKAVYALRRRVMMLLLNRLTTLKDDLLNEEIHGAIIDGITVFVLPKKASAENMQKSLLTTALTTMLLYPTVHRPRSMFRLVSLIFWSTRCLKSHGARHFRHLQV